MSTQSTERCIYSGLVRWKLKNLFGIQKVSRIKTFSISLKIRYLGFSDCFATSLHCFLLFPPLLAGILKQSLFRDLAALRMMMLFRHFSSFSIPWCIHWTRIWRSSKIWKSFKNCGTSYRQVSVFTYIHFLYSHCR